MNLYSHSRLSCFEQCPLKFKFAYIDKIETEIEETVEAFLGSRVHETLEKLYKDLKFQKLNSLNELLGFFNSEWKKNWNDAIVIVRQEYDPENYRKMGEKFITDYYNRYSPFDQSRVIGLETQNTVALDDKYKIHVRIDRLCLTDDTVYEIHDYKTSNTLPAQEYLDNDRQLAVYAYGIKKMYPDASNVRLVWHYLAFDKEMTSERTPQELENLRLEVLELIKKIESEQKFPSKTSALCSWCEFQSICPEWKHRFDTEKLEVNEYLNEDGVKLANEFSKLKEEHDKLAAKVDLVREALIAYCRKNDIQTVFGSDVKVFVRAYPKLSFPKKGDPLQNDFFEAIRKIGLWDKLATVDVYSLAKMINNGEVHPELLKILGQYIEKGENIRVGLSRK